MKRRKTDTRADVMHTIREHLKKECGIEPTNVEMYTELRAELGLDSYELTGLSIELQDVYGVILSDDALNGRVADIIEEIMDHE